MNNADIDHKDVDQEDAIDSLHNDECLSDEEKTEIYPVW